MKFLLIYVPNLRFNNDPYKKYNLYEFATRVTRKNKDDVSNLPLTISAQYGLVDQVSFFNKTVASKDMSGYYLLKNGEFAYNKSDSNDYPWGAIKRLDLYDMGCLSTLYICFKTNDNVVNSNYLVHYFESSKWHKQVADIAGEGARNHGLLNIAVNDFFNTKHAVPTIENQIKIARFLDLIEKRIQTQIKIIELKQSLIKDIEDRILWKTTNTQTKPIREFLTEINNKSIIQNQYPLLSSTKKGLFLQTDYFNKEAASSNNIGYKIVYKGDIIISPQNLWMGNITYNDKFDNGLVSPSYRIYKVKEEYNAFYISRILMSYRALSLYKNISEQGASIVRRNLNVDAFNELCFPIPNIKKQDEVGLFLSKLHQELKYETWILMQLKSQKNYLLNNMFI